MFGLLGSRPKEEGIEIGGHFVRDMDRTRHSQIVGPSGSGKTELTKTLAFEDIRRGRGCFIIDPKGDRELYDEIQGYCRSVGRETDLKFLSATYPDESSFWNPCGLGNASELQSKFFNSNLYTEAHYAKACELGLLQAFNQLTEKKPSGFNLQDLVSELKFLAQEQKSKDLDGLFYDFGSLAQSEWGQILGCSGEEQSEREVSLLDCVLGNQILFVHLPTEGKSIQSSRVGRLLTQELILISGLKKSFPELNRGGVFSVFIDEFDAFATESFVTFLNKGRSSNFMIHIAHQTLSDLKKFGLEYAGQIIGNCNLHFIFRQDNPDDSDFWSRSLGTKTVVRKTYQTQDGMQTGVSSNREAQEFNVSPDELRKLKIGELFLWVKNRHQSKKIKLSLPKKYGTSPSNQKSQSLDQLLRAKKRGTVSLKHEKTRAQEIRELSPRSFEGVVPSIPADASESSASQPVSKWNGFSPKN
jgi:hypothetical protein